MSPAPHSSHPIPNLASTHTTNPMPTTSPTPNPATTTMDSPPSTTKTCSHCQLPYPQSSLKTMHHEGKELYFCCQGCEGVYFLLHENHLESFYDKLAHQSLTPPDADKQNENLTSFDTPSFLQKYAIKDSQGYLHVSLILEGIHCLACTWLIENLLLNQAGIHEVAINYTNNKLKLIFDPSTLRLSEIVKLIRSSGYDATIYDPSLSEQNFLKQNKSYYHAMIVAIFCTMNIMWIAIAQYAGYFLGMSSSMKDALNLASFLLATPVLFWTGRFFYLGAFRQLRNGLIGMDLLVSTGAMLTYSYSIYAALTRSGETYFEAVSMILTFVFIGKFLEIKTKKNAGDSLDRLSFILPTQVTQLLNGQKISHSPQEIAIGSIIEVAPNEVIALDGILLSPTALLDTQNISGESLPVLKSQNESITSGSINTQQTFTYKTTKLFADSLLFKLVDILGHTLSQKPQIQNLANSLAQHFSRAVLLIAALSFLAWYFLAHSSFEYALMIAISVIVISCPCALALATPIASIIGIKEAYEQKIIFKESKFLETIAKATRIIFDKTGTLTLGTPQVLEQITLKDFDASLLLSLLSYSKHPVANSIREFYEAQGIKPESTLLKSAQEILGKGVCGELEGRILRGGSLDFLQECGIDAKNFDLQSHIGFGFSIDDALCAVFLLEDSPKSHAKALIANLTHFTPNITLLSGDHEKSVFSLASTLGIKDFHASLLPQDKANFIQDYQNRGEITLMVGDGINDALALSKSDIGIAFNTQNSITPLASDIIFLDQSLENLQNTLQISHKTYQIIKQNIAISILYNALMIPLAIFGFIIPLFAALSMSLSSLLVIANSMRIKNWQNYRIKATPKPHHPTQDSADSTL